MTERIVILSDKILGLTKVQDDRLSENDFDGMNSILDKRAALIGELGEILQTFQMPSEARNILSQALELSDTQMELARVKQSELTLEFTNTKRSYESIGAYHHSAMDTVRAVGSMYDRRT